MARKVAPMSSRDKASQAGNSGIVGEGLVCWVGVGVRVELKSGFSFESVLISQKSQSPVSKEPMPPDKANPPSMV